MELGLLARLGLTFLSSAGRNFDNLVRARHSSRRGTYPVSITTASWCAERQGGVHSAYSAHSFPREFMLGEVQALNNRPRIRS